MSNRRPSITSATDKVFSDILGCYCLGVLASTPGQYPAILRNLPLNMVTQEDKPALDDNYSGSKVFPLVRKEDDLL